MSTESDFENWAKTRWLTKPFYMKNHKFEKIRDGSIKIDRAIFEFEEAHEIARMLDSRNPVSQLSAQLAIWERNGTAVKAILVATILLLIIVILFLRR
jgi:hypothetical protein